MRILGTSAEPVGQRQVEIQGHRTERLKSACRRQGEVAGYCFKFVGRVEPDRAFASRLR